MCIQGAEEGDGGGGEGERKAFYVDIAILTSITSETCLAVKSPCLLIPHFYFPPGRVWVWEGGQQAPSDHCELENPSCPLQQFKYLQLGAEPSDMRVKVLLHSS